MRGLSTVQAHKPCSISLVPRYPGVSCAKDWISVDCGTIIATGYCNFNIFLVYLMASRFESAFYK